MEAITIHPKSKQQARLFEQLAKALDVPFIKEGKSPYDPKFVAKVTRAEKNFKAGKFTIMKIEDLWK
jgi:hypothetical protein